MRSHTTLLAIVVAALFSLTLAASSASQGPRRLDSMRQHRRLFGDMANAIHDATTRAEAGWSNLLQKLGLPPIGPEPNTKTPVLAPQAFKLPTVMQQGSTAIQKMALNANWIFASLGDQPVATTSVGNFHGVKSPAIFNQQWWLGEYQRAASKRRGTPC